MITHLYLQKRFRYLENGRLVWKTDPTKSPQWNGKHAHSVAGCIRPDGRYVIRLDGKLYLGSRLIWLWHNNTELPEEIDHRDKNETNDRIENLFPSNRFKNNANTTAKGYTRLGPNRFWARIFSKGKAINLGIFKTKEEARKAYITAQQKIVEENYV